MRFRQQSELGWMMLQWLGALCLPHVTRDASLDAARAAAMGRHRGRRGGMSAGLASSVMAPIQGKCPGCGALFPRADIAPPEGLCPGCRPAECETCKGTFSLRDLQGWPYGQICTPCYWALH